MNTHKNVITKTVMIITTATTINNLITSSVILSRLDVIQAGSGPDEMIFGALQLELKSRIFESLFKAI